MAPLHPYSFQLWSAREFPPVEDQFATLSALGYTNVEPVIKLIEDPENYRALLNANGLVAKSSHHAIELIEADPQKAIAISKAIGCETVIVPWVEPGDRPTDTAGWRAIGKRLETIANTFAREGLKVGWHNHNFEFVTLPDGSMPIDHLLVDGVLWEVDVCWLIKAEQDPKIWLDRFKGRIPGVHMKDIAPAGEKLDEDGWADLGTGIVPWADIWPVAVATGAELMIAEHDNPNDYKRFARNSIDALKRLSAA